MYWGFIDVAMTLLTFYLMVLTWQFFLNNPTVTTLVDASYPINKIPFPGISICNLNKISKKRAQILSYKLANVTEKEPELFMEYIPLLGQLFDLEFTSNQVDKLLQFEKILVTAGMKMRHIMRNLATSCEELLETCYWQNKQIPCSKLFQMRLTHEGYCCVFNYNKKTPNMLKNQEIIEKPLKTFSGIKNGLYFEVTNHPEDYMYPTLHSIGIFVNVFGPTDYPDKTSGSLTEILVDANSENFLEIVPVTIIADDEVIHYPLSMRQCVFDEEISTNLDKIYSQSDCNVNCRVNNTLALCQCFQFKIPYDNEELVCTLEDLPCLNKYKKKWFTLFPEGITKDLLQERQYSLRCKEKCYPKCEGTSYSVQVNAFATSEKMQKSNVYVYYGRRFVHLYKKEVVFYWFEILGKFGGMFAVIMGFSVLSMIEIGMALTQFILRYLKIK